MIRYIDSVLSHKTILLRVDCNVSLTKEGKIEDDFRVIQVLPTIELLLKQHNTLILLSHLGKPNGIDSNSSLKPVVADLKRYIQEYDIRLVETIEELQTVAKEPNTILFLENTRFFNGEIGNTGDFAKNLAGCAEIFVNDAFSVCHRSDATVVGIPQFLPSYGGLLLKKEVTTLSGILENPKHPFVVVMGGAKVSTKIGVIKKILDIADTILVGGGIANTFLKANGFDIKGSFYEEQMVEVAKELWAYADNHHHDVILPEDFVWGQRSDQPAILDIGEKTMRKYSEIIKQAKVVVWNGPMGFAEDARFQDGTNAILDAMAENRLATTVIGGGDTIAILKNNFALQKISHVSTGGGAMLEFIEKGNLPGLEALINSKL